MEESRKVYGWLIRDGNAAAGCSSMWADTRGGENYCGNLLWQSSLTLLFPFRRYLEVGKLLDMKIAAVRDNDGNPQKWYEDLQSDNRKVFSDPIKERKTFEVCLYQDNKDVLDSIFPDREFVLDYMLKHKAEAAYQILVANQKLVVPQYIKEAIEWIWRP